MSPIPGFGTYCIATNQVLEFFFFKALTNLKGRTHL